MDQNATAKTNSGENAKHSQNRRRRATIFLMSEGGLIYETICYVCIALAIAIKIVVIANAIPENKSLGRQTWAI